MPNLICACCNKPNDDHKMVCCCICKNHFSHSCVDLTTSEARIIKSKKNLSWTCQNCSQIGDDINDLKCIMLTLKKEVETLKAIKSDPAHNANNVDYEEIIQEITERNNRKRNIIIYGISEDNTLPKSEKSIQDKSEVINVLHTLTPSLNLDNVNPYRLGKFDATKITSRPIRVVLNDEQTVFDLIKKAKNLQNHNSYSKIRISLDRTPRQLEYYRSLKMELDRRTSEGATNLRIKYIRGVPKIAALN